MSKKIVTLTESDLVRMVKRVIKESDEKSTFELKMETTPEEQLDSVIQEFFANKTEAEIKEYFMELKNKKPKWLRKLLIRLKNPKNKNKKINWRQVGNVLTFYSLALMFALIFDINLNQVTDLPSKIVGIDEHKNPHHGDNKTTQYAPIQNFDNLVKLGFRKTGEKYIGVSKATNTTYYLTANGTGGNGTYTAVAMGKNYSGTWKFDDNTACPSNLTNCKIFKGVKLLTSVAR